MLRRAASMAFAPGALVFPGGGRDPQDGDIQMTAVRELFEESGLLLAVDSDGVWAQPDAADWEAQRVAVQAHDVTFSSVLAEHGLRIRWDALTPWGRWVTPRFLRHRYDTWFFVAEVPEGQEPRHVGGEAIMSHWVAARDLAGGGPGLMQPTVSVLRDLAAVDRVADLAAPPDSEPLLYELIEADGGLYLELEGR